MHPRVEKRVLASAVKKIVIVETEAARKQLSVKNLISRQKNERKRLQTRGCLVSETGSGRELKCYETGAKFDKITQEEPRLKIQMIQTHRQGKKEKKEMAKKLQGKFLKVEGEGEDRGAVRAEGVGQV